MKTLYKKDSKGKIRTLELSTEGSLFVQVSGILDGKKVRHEKECKPKNVGKKNATTSDEQARAEMSAKYTNKLTEGYYPTKDEAEREEVLMPMLAKVYEEHAHKIDWENAFIQPKLDGMRCLAVIKDGKVTLLSRKNKEILTMDHIKEELERLEDCIIDGELYAHDKTFQENMKLIKKYRKGESELVKFHVYDMVDDKHFSQRYYNLIMITEKYGWDYLEVVPTQKITEEAIKPYHSQFLEKGYEGSMVRWGTDGYKINGRSDSLLKYKDFIDETFRIIDIEPADARPEWGTPVFEAVTGEKFRAGTKMSHDDKKDLLANKDKYIDKLAEVRFFEYTDGGLVPRFPVMVGIRLDK
jgi:ATP-dependent DNA ligase